MAVLSNFAPPLALPQLCHHQQDLAFQGGGVLGPFHRALSRLRWFADGADQVAGSRLRASAGLRSNALLRLTL